ncbi:hypothetical protein O7627_22900 [Solwaraspora sp. WMMD1047]|uniref:hypothetical protein n=1 Tax=Solwaraspora sp. WMMD1047 TaxID=3016102 RepID=UPI00241800C1|nr:hypothetical protein [Solwaraspora sp. WMMD1047]MDG4832135.1 hypothetical protein [Solwaraspora sp. WMMD1047]
MAGRAGADDLDDAAHVRAAARNRYATARGAGPRVGEPVWRPDATTPTGYAEPETYAGSETYAEPERYPGSESYAEPAGYGGRSGHPDTTAYAEPVEVLVPAQGGATDADEMWRPPTGAADPAAATGPAAPTVDESTDEPADEPAAQRLGAGDEARLAQLAADVMVVDGRPRFHLPGCPHLRGRETDLLPVGEAVELGFTPCSRCAPATALLAETPGG